MSDVRTVGPSTEANPTYRAILVPLDRSRLAAGALPTAHALAERFGATVHTVGVAGRDASAMGLDIEITTLREEAARALGTDPDDERVHVETDRDVAGVIHRRAGDLGACLVCMSTHGRGRVTGALMGSVAQDVVERGCAPVVAVGPLVGRTVWEDEVLPPPLDTQHLVACVDGTPASEQILPVAAAWSRALGMRLTVVTVAEPCPSPTRIGEPWRRRHGPDADVDEYLRDLGERWVEVMAGTETHGVYDPISAADGIKRYLAEDPAGLVAVASHLRDGLERMRFGAAAAEIARSSTAPTLVIPITPTDVATSRRTPEP